MNPDRSGLNLVYGWEASTDVLLLVLFDFSTAFKWLIELAPHRRVVRIRSCPAVGWCWACQQVLSVTEECTDVPGSFHKELFFLHLILRAREERQTHFTRQPKRVSGRHWEWVPQGDQPRRTHSRPREHQTQRQGTRVSFQTTPVLLCKCPWFVKRPLDVSHSYFMFKERALNTTLMEK